MAGTVDLHTHSIHSDGTWTPTQVVERALARGLSAIALTDHDSVDGLDEARSRAAGTSLEIVPGVELSAFDGSVEVHVLGYYVDDHDAEFRLSLQQFREQRLLRAHAILERLEELGFDLSWDEILERARGGAIGRPHIAEAMIAAGDVHTIDEAFRRYLGTRGSAYIAAQVADPARRHRAGPPGRRRGRDRPPGDHGEGSRRRRDGQGRAHRPRGHPPAPRHERPRTLPPLVREVRAGRHRRLATATASAPAIRRSATATCPAPPSRVCAPRRPGSPSKRGPSCRAKPALDRCFTGFLPCVQDGAPPSAPRALAPLRPGKDASLNAPLLRTRRLALAGMFAGLAWGAGYVESVPNFEFLTVLLFAGGFVLGPAWGAFSGGLGAFLFSAVNPYGSGLAVPLVLAAQVAGMAFAGAVGGFLGRAPLAALPSPFLRAAVVVAAGVGVTVVYDLLTNLASAVLFGPSCPRSSPPCPSPPSTWGRTRCSSPAWAARSSARSSAPAARSCPPVSPSCSSSPLPPARRRRRGRRPPGTRPRLRRASRSSLRGSPCSAARRWRPTRSTATERRPPPPAWGEGRPRCHGATTASARAGRPARAG